MTKQEEIREGIRKHIESCLLTTGANIDYAIKFAESVSISLPVILDRLGVVIKGMSLGHSHSHLDAYFSVEPLM